MAKHVYPLKSRFYGYWECKCTAPFLLQRGWKWWTKARYTWSVGFSAASAVNKSRHRRDLAFFKIVHKKQDGRCSCCCQIESRSCCCNQDNSHWCMCSDRMCRRQLGFSNSWMCMQASGGGELLFRATSLKHVLCYNYNISRLKALINCLPVCVRVCKLNVVIPWNSPVDPPVAVP